jgi:hypothetical protein
MPKFSYGIVALCSAIGALWNGDRLQPRALLLPRKCNELLPYGRSEPFPVAWLCPDGEPFSRPKKLRIFCNKSVAVSRS